MILVVDSNIIFSALLNPKSTIGQLLFDVQNKFEFYAPNYLWEEIENYEDKIAKHTKLNSETLKTVKSSVYTTVQLISEELIRVETWNKALELAEDIDEKDTPFIALTLELQTKLWTGDKKLIEGLTEKQTELTITTEELKTLLNE